MDGVQRRRPLGLVERPGDVVDLFCSECGRVVFTIWAEDPHSVVSLRLAEGSHAITCPGDRHN
jgi:hypothetical protein